MARTDCSRVKALESSREKHIVGDVTLLSKVIGRLLKDRLSPKKNLYNMDKTSGYAVYARYGKILSR